MSKIFVDRRKGADRRLEQDRCKDLPLDLFHRKRRKSADRRASGRSLTEDYFAFMEAGQSPEEPCQATEDFSSKISNLIDQEDKPAIN